MVAMVSKDENSQDFQTNFSWKEQSTTFIEDRVQLIRG